MSLQSEHDVSSRPAASASSSMYSSSLLLVEETTTKTTTSISIPARSYFYDNNSVSNNTKHTFSTPISSTNAAGQLSSDRFPRWGDVNGINVDGIIKYFEFASQFNTPRDLLHPDDYPIPNVLYVFGGTITIGGEGYRSTSRPTHPEVVVAAEREKWKLIPKPFRNGRYRPLEDLMTSALDHLLLSTKKTKDDDSRWSRLRELVTATTNVHYNMRQEQLFVGMNGIAANNTTTNKTFTANNIPRRLRGGIPMIVHLPDNRHCNYQNFDSSTNGSSLSVPIFHVSGSYDSFDCNYTFPIPTYSMINFIRDHERSQNNKTWDDTFREQNQAYPVQSKLSKVVWRGSNTGVTPELRHLHHKLNNDTRPLRIRMIQTANNNATTAALFFDVRRVSGKSQKKASTTSSFYLPQQDVQKYKGVLDVDGNSWSERFGKLLCMNTVVLKVEPEFVDYFMPSLQAWTHYIPVKMDSSDLQDIAAYVLNPKNERQIQQIVQNANRWCSQQMTWNKVVADVLDILSNYVGLLDKFDAGWFERWSNYIEDYNPFMASPTNNRLWKVFNTG